MKTYGLVLAGGRSSRMGLRLPKPLLSIGASTMLDLCIDRLRGHTDEMLISANDPTLLERADATGLIDIDDGYPGPVGGLRAAASFCRENAGRDFRLVTVPGDTPFLPIDLVPRLLGTGDGEAIQIAMFDGHPQPVCALWPSRQLLDLLTLDLDASRAPSLRSLMEHRAYRTVEFPPDQRAPSGNPFFNVNTPDDLQIARHHAVLGDRDVMEG